VLGSSSFRRLFGVRLTGQFSDGLVQAALTTFVLFSPEREASAPRIAIAFVILLLPYSLIGPFVGVFLDRWRRREVLVTANLFRVASVALLGLLLLAGHDGVDLAIAVLVTLGIGRFVLSALAASLPHTVEAEACCLGRVADPLEAKVVLQQGMETEVKAVEALQVLRFNGCLLVAQVAGELVDEFRRRCRRQPSHRFHLEGATQEHVLAGVGNLDERNARAALRNDVDQPLGSQAVHRFADGEAGNPHACGDGLLVEELARFQVELDDGFTQGGMHAGRGALGRNSAWTQEIIGDGSHWHANMLAIFIGRASPAAEKRAFR